MNALKNKLLFGCLIALLFCCNTNNKKSKSIAIETDEEKLNRILIEYNCKEEIMKMQGIFITANFIINMLLNSDCSSLAQRKNFEIRDSIPLSFLDISLRLPDGIDIYEDTLFRFSFKTYFNDSCICIGTPQNGHFFPGAIMINRKTKLIEYDLGRSYFMFETKRSKIDSILNNKNIKPFILKHRDKVNKWFLSEYFKRNKSNR
jgi:hypothetical protein